MLSLVYLCRRPTAKTSSISGNWHVQPTQYYDDLYKNSTKIKRYANSVASHAHVSSFTWEKTARTQRQTVSTRSIQSVLRYEQFNTTSQTTWRVVYWRPAINTKCCMICSESEICNRHKHEDRRTSVSILWKLLLSASTFRIHS